MSVARITTLNFKSKEGADQVEETYKNSAPTEFAEAEQLLEVRVDDTTLMFVSLYMLIMMQWNELLLQDQKEWI